MGELACHDVQLDSHSSSMLFSAWFTVVALYADQYACRKHCCSLSSPPRLQCVQPNVISQQRLSQALLF